MLLSVEDRTLYAVVTVGTVAAMAGELLILYTTRRSFLALKQKQRWRGVMVFLAGEQDSGVLFLVLREFRFSVQCGLSIYTTLILSIFSRLLQKFLQLSRLLKDVLFSSRNFQSISLSFKKKKLKSHFTTSILFLFLFLLQFSLVYIFLTRSVLLKKIHFNH